MKTVFATFRSYPAGFVFSLALVLRLIALAYVDTRGDGLRHGFFTYAGSEYVSMAHGLLTRGDFTLEFLWGHAMPSAYQPPLYPLFLALVFRIRGLPFPAAMADMPALIGVQLANCLAGAIWCVVLYALARHVFNGSVGRIAALIGIFYPTLVYSVAEAHPLNFFLLLLLVFLYAACLTIPEATHTRNDGKPVRYSASAWSLGISAGLLALTRSECLPLCLLILTGLAVQLPDQRKQMGLAMLICVVVYSPWLIRNYRDFGSLVLTNTSGANLFRGQGPFANGGTYAEDGAEIWFSPEIRAEIRALPITKNWELRQDVLLRHETMLYIRQHPLRPLWLMPKKLFLFLVRDGSHPKGKSPLVWLPGLLLLLLALRGGWQTRRQLRRAWPLVVVPVFYTLIVLVFFSLPRYRMMIDPVLMVFAAAALCRVRIGSKTTLL